MKAPYNRTTPDVVTSLKPHEVFVFGSNRQGFHSAGAAATAYRSFGAVWAVGEGLQGQSYAVPTKRTPWQRLSLGEIGSHVGAFCYLAEEQTQLHFLVTEIGCGLAGYTPLEIAPLFHGAVDLDNVSLPASFWDFYCPTCHCVVDLGYCACDEE